MSYRILHDNIGLPSKGHDFASSFQEGDSAWGIVCDGVSNSFDPAQAATRAGMLITNYVKNQLQAVQNVDYASAYSDVVEKFNLEAKQFAESLEYSGKPFFSTTVITGYIRDNIAEFSYCGNGSIIEISSEWFKLPDEIPTPWGINNHLNPHSRLIDGENRLFKAVKATDKPETCTPDVLRISKESNRNYYLICTDGLYSSDEISTGWDEESKDYYLIENRKLIVFLKLLKKYHTHQWTDMSEFSLEFRKLIGAEVVGDDLSYVLFIPEI